MTNIQCAVCRAKTDANLCKSCTEELEQALAELPADLADLQAVATRQASGPLGLGDPQRQWDGVFEEGSLGDAPWEFAPAAADQLWVIRNTTLTWARHLTESRGLPFELRRVPSRRPAGPVCAAHVHDLGDPGCDDGTCKQFHPNHVHRPSRSGCPDNCRRLHCGHQTCEAIRRPEPQDTWNVIAWLLRNLDSIRYDEAAQQIHDELTALHAENQRWTLGRSGQEKFAGRCDAAQITFELDGDTLVPVAATCGAALYGYEEEAEVRCQACGMRYPLQERLAEMRDRQINDQLARAHTIANALTTQDEPLSPSTLRTWIQRDSEAAPSPEGPACYECKHHSCRLIRRPLILQKGTDDEGHPLYRVGDVRARLRLVEQQRGVRLSA